MLQRLCLLMAVAVLVAGCGDEIVTGARELAESGKSIHSGLTAEQASQVLNDAEKWPKAPNTSQLAQEFRENLPDANRTLNTVSASVASPNLEYERKVACAVVDYANTTGRLPDPANTSDDAATAALVGLASIPRFELQGAVDDLNGELSGHGNDYLFSLGIVCNVRELSGFADG